MHMYKYYSFLMTNLLVFSLYSQSISFLNLPFQQLKEKAQSENKFLFIDCYTEWCGWCKVMDKNTFSNPEVISYMNEKFIAAKIDMEKGQGVDLAMKYRVTGFPSYLIFSPAGKLVYKTFGYQQAKDFIKNLENSQNVLKQQNYSGVSDELFLNFPAFYRTVFEGGGNRKWPDSIEVNAFFINENNWFGEVAFSVLSRFDVPDTVSRFFLKNIDQYRYLYGIDAEDKISGLIYDRISSAIKEKDLELAGEAFSMIDLYVKEDKNELKQAYMLRYLSETGDWKKFTETFQKILDSEGYKNLGMINNYSWDIYKTCTDNDVILKAVQWMKKVIEISPEYMYLDTYAALLYKTKNYNEAEIWAKNALKTGKKNKEDVKETKKLLEMIKHEKKNR